MRLGRERAMMDKLILDRQLLTMIQIADDETAGKAFRMYLEDLIDEEKPVYHDDAANLLMMFFRFKTELGDGEEDADGE